MSKELKNFNYNEQDLNKIFKELKRSKETISFLNKKINTLSQFEIKKEDIRESLFNSISSAKFKSYAAPKNKESKDKFSRSLVLHISDTHIGVRISKKEMGGINEFNEKIACSRFSFLFEQAVKYKPEHRKDTDLHIILNGDIIAGVIHSQEFGVELITNQLAQALNIFIQGISYCANNFKSVKVHCTVGNHGRVMHKSNKGRQSDHKWDSFETILYLGLKHALKSYKNVQFNIPETPYTLFKIQGHNFLATHGDTVINVGNVGKTLKIENMSNQILNIQLGLEEKVSAVMVGHVHVATYQVLQNGCALIINGTLSGVDPFAQSIGINSNNTFQQMFEVTEEFKVGDLRFIDLKNASKSKSDIITPLNSNF